MPTPIAKIQIRPAFTSHLLYAFLLFCSPVFLLAQGNQGTQTDSTALDPDTLGTVHMLDNKKNEVLEFFFIQLASLSQEKIDYIDYYPYRELGQLYVFKIDGLQKVRLGTFYNQETADAILRLIKKSGFKDAFVTTGDFRSYPYELLY